MKHLGDITKINGALVAPVNVIIGGSPCQDLSIAGRREGLAGERSGLYMEQLRVIKEMRCADIARGRTGRDIRPRWMVWENVPGAFSSNRGEDFATVLHEAIKIVCPEAPPVPVPGGGWPTKGRLVDVDGRWSLAWRVFDAQFWGVPQRRRRIALVVDFGGLTAPEILFVRKGLSGGPYSGKTPWQTFACPPGAGLAKTGPRTEPAAFAVRMRAGCEGGGKGALVQVERSGTLGCTNDQTVFCMATQQGGGRSPM